MGAGGSNISNILGTEASSTHSISSKRILNHFAFAKSITAYKSHLNARPLKRCVFTSENSGLKVVCRKRPINNKEIGLGDFDVLSCGGGKLISEGFKKSIWLHRCLFRLDMKHLYIEHHGYEYDAVFDENDSTDIIFRDAIGPLVEQSTNGGKSAVIMFGATGSGKTFTINELFRQSAQQIYASIPSHLETNEKSEVVPNGLKVKVSLQAIEVSGSKVTDMFTGNIVTLMEDQEGNTNLVGGTDIEVASAEELVDLFHQCASNRITRATGVHNASSRSHAVYKICINAYTHDDNALTLVRSGDVTLTDLAGSEWSRDQTDHDEQRRKESQEINASLMVLKQCINYRSAYDRGLVGPDKGGEGGGQANGITRAPYRESKITRILKDCFVGKLLPTVVIATVSPSSSDTEHTQDVLSLTCVRGHVMGGGGGEATSESEHEGAGGGAEGSTASDVLPGQQEDWDGGADAGEVTPPQIPIHMKRVSQRPEYNVHSNEGQSIFVTNVDELAITDQANGEERNLANNSSNPNDLSNEIKVHHDTTCAPFEDTHPSKWTTQQVVEWFTQSASRACSEVSADVTSRLEGSSESKYNAFDVVLSAKKWVSLRMEGKDGIGLAFANASTMNRSTDAIENGTSMEVSGVLGRGYISMCRDPRLQVGCQLVAIQNRTYSSQKEFTSALKSALKEFKECVVKQRAYDENKQKFMTDDMKALRHYILNGPQNTVYNKSSQQNSELLDQSVISSNHEDPKAISNSTEDAIAQPVVTLENPEDVLLRLKFRTAANSNMPKMPHMPRVFTGENRLGEIWSGKELCEKYVSEGPNRFITTCDGDDRVAMKMFDDLKKLMGEK